MKRVG
jgi:hypothetical protein